MDTPKLLRPPIVLLSLLLAAACAAPPSSPGPTGPPPRPSTPPSAAPSPTAGPGSPSPSAPAVRVEAAAPMLRARTGFDAIVLGDGTVLAVGDDMACLPGPAEPGSETAERYDPITDRWTAAASLNKPRKSFATVLLPDGRALVVGGTNPDDQLYSSTKLFDPEAGSWTDGPLLGLARHDPAAAVLGDGRVVIGSVTRVDETNMTTTTEVLDAAVTGWSNGDLIDGWSMHTFTALTDGRVIAVGDGFEIDQALFLLDPSTSRWTAIDPPTVVRQIRIVPLDGGDALAFGYSDAASGPSRSAERFDRASGTWTMTAPMAIPREAPMIARLADGRVLVAGGAVYDADGVGVQAVATTEIYDPATDTWSAGPDLLEPRKAGGALLLPDGSVLIVGGDASFNTAGDVPWCPEPLTSVERVYL